MLMFILVSVLNISLIYLSLKCRSQNYKRLYFETLNTSLICISLKYLRKNYESITNVSKWIHFELTKCNYKESKFIRSLYKKDLEIIKILIDFNKNTDLLSEYLLHCCLFRNNYFDIVKILIENGADVHVEGDMPLKCASELGHFNIVKILIENGAKVDASDNQALIMASYNGHLDVVKLLIENGANICDDAIGLARYNSHTDVVNFLKNID